MQPGQQSAFHGGGVDFLHRHTAAGHDSLFHGGQAAQRNGQGLQGIPQALAILAGDLAAGLAAVHPAQLRKKLRHSPRQQPRQHIAQLLAALFLQVALKPRVQLLGGEPRFQVQRNLRLGQVLRQMAAHGQRQRSGNAEMRKEHFSQLAVKHFFSLSEGQRHVFQRKPLQPTGPVRRRFDGVQHPGQRLDAVSGGLSQGIAVAVRAGHGIGFPAAGQYHRVRGNGFTVFQQHPRHAAVLLHKCLHPAVQPHLHPRLLQKPRQRAVHVAGLLRAGKHPPPALGFHRAAGLLQQGHHVLRREEAQRAVQEARVAGHLPEKLVQGAVVGQVAAALAGDVHLLAQLLIAFQQGDPRALPGREKRRQHAARAAADHRHLTHDVPLPPGRFRRCPKWFPACGSAR